ncbi:MAG TPA: tRNA (N(6)-L-threonylcarbamoyladenosine(37)-C(2))-methylthiotransferase MtaB [Planctomycetaceae bacterium]|nr:tRNA (N(6)-L-threonylcarbamoyladenosine(37)-C(2))-methylthiotransferase MtaB [Planctomycetaceae bacterium]
MPILKTVTLGCKVNQYETEYLRQALRGVGYREAAGGEAADLCLVNTCTVTAEGALKSRKAIRQLARENPQAKIIVMGCYATDAPDAVASLPGVVQVVRDKKELPHLLAQLGLPDAPTGISSFGRRHRAYVKIQDGCRAGCAYCVIPRVRPRLWSRPAEEVVAEIRRLIDGGYSEVVLTGIHLGHYGLDSNASAGQRQGRTLTELVHAILGLKGQFRVRLSSLEAAEVTPELIQLMRDHPDRLCPHLHLPLQSGSDAVLKRMRRRWSSGQFVERCLAVRESLDEPALTTDVIVGFPGETAADFEATCRVIQEVGFSKVHCFRFSPRRGTPAATMPNQVPGRVKRRRAAELIRLGQGQRREYCERLVGRRLQVLAESVDPDHPENLLGTAGRYVPVRLAGTATWLGRLLWVRAEGLGGHCIEATPADSNGAGKGTTPRQR